MYLYCREFVGYRLGLEARMTKTRGIALVAIALVALGGILWWTQRGGDKPAAPTVAQGSGSAGTRVTPVASTDAVKPARVAVVVNGPQGPLVAATVRLSR